MKPLVVHEQSSDIADQGAEATETFLAAELANARAKVEPESHPDFDGANCVECGTELPKQRLLDLRVRCTCCQQRREYEAKQWPSK